MSDIPILNVYYLLCYAWRHMEEAEIVSSSELERLHQVQDLLGRVLAAGVHRLIRRGIDRDYQKVYEEIAGVRGKLLIGDTVKQALRIQGRTACMTEELSHDVLHNRLLKSTLRDLLRVRRLNDSVRSEVRSAYRGLMGISELRVTRQAFRRVQLDRNRRLYRFLLAVSRLIHESLLVGEAAGQGHFFDFRQEDRQMWRLFEEFVTEFLRREQRIFRVNPSGRRIRWSGTAGAPADLAKIPRMEADVILESASRRIILDTKYYGRSLTQKSTMHSPNLYQLLAYLRNRQALHPDGPKHEGILLYPVVGKPLRVDVQLEGFRLQARSLDLAQPWQEIHRTLLTAVDCADNKGDGAARGRLDSPQGLG